MEHSVIKDVIVLQTVREELRHLSLPIYNRVNAILADKNRRFYLFANEHHRYVVLCPSKPKLISRLSSDTFLDKMKDESPNDRNDRCKCISP